MSRLTDALTRLATDPAYAATVDADLDQADAAAAAEHAARAAQVRRKVYEQHRPAGYATANLAELLPQQNPNRTVTRFLTSPATTLWLTGPSGHGKSYAAWALCNHAAYVDGWVVAGWNVARLRAALATRDAHERFDHAAANRQARIDAHVHNARLLLLDDLGAERDDSFGQAAWDSCIYELIDHRVGNGLRTVVTSNAQSGANARDIITATYGSATLGRLAEDAWWAHIEGRQLRAHAPTDGGLL